MSSMKNEKKSNIREDLYNFQVPLYNSIVNRY